MCKSSIKRRKPLKWKIKKEDALWFIVIAGLMIQIGCRIALAIIRGKESSHDKRRCDGKELH